jgi:hypothetical protein
VKSRDERQGEDNDEYLHRNRMTPCLAPPRNPKLSAFLANRNLAVAHSSHASHLRQSAQSADSLSSL